MWPIIGHEWAVELLARSIETHRLRHAYLFVGPSQVGKRTLAMTFAQAILCTNADAPCGTCRSCMLVRRERHPDVYTIAPESNRIKISTIREMLHSVALSPIEGRYRVCTISRFDRATTSAANALLKTLEEPPSTLVLLLTANAVEALPSTIASRCQVVSLRPPPTEQIVAALKDRGIEPDQARLLGHLAQGRVGWAVAATQDKRVLEQRARLLEGILGVAQGSLVERFRWAERLSRKPELVSPTLDAMLSWWRDVLLLASESTTPIANVDQEPEIRDWAARYPVDAAQRVLQAVRDTAWRIERNANLRLALEVLALDLPDRRE